MRIEFHRTGAERKALVTAIGEILEVRPKYKGMPSAAYEIDYFFEVPGSSTFSMQLPEQWVVTRSFKETHLRLPGHWMPTSMRPFPTDSTGSRSMKWCRS